MYIDTYVMYITVNISAIQDVDYNDPFCISRRS